MQAILKTLAPLEKLGDAWLRFLRRLRRNARLRHAAASPRPDIDDFHRKRELITDATFENDTLCVPSMPRFQNTFQFKEILGKGSLHCRYFLVIRSGFFV